MTPRAALVAAAAAAAVMPLPRGAVERLYSRGAYASMQPIVTSVSNRVPFALLDVLIVAVLAAWIVLAVRDLWHGRSRLRAAGWIALRTLSWAAVAYLAFLLLWGFNYRRLPLTDKLRFDAAAVSADAAGRMGEIAADELNRLYPAARSAGPAIGVEPALRAAFDRTMPELGASSAVAGRPKSTLLAWYFRRAGVDGMTDPFFLETLVSDDLLPFERPFVLAHEWSHLAGLADEGEANFAGWLTCLHASPADRYSGWLFLYSELAGAAGGRRREALAARLGPGPRADLAAVRDRLRRNVSPRVSAAGWRVYDSYLKANRVEAGAASYALVVRLVLGVTFDEDWRPLPQ